MPRLKKQEYNYYFDGTEYFGAASLAFA